MPIAHDSFVIPTNRCVQQQKQINGKQKWPRWQRRMPSPWPCATKTILALRFFDASLVLTANTRAIDVVTSMHGPVRASFPLACRTATPRTGPTSNKHGRIAVSNGRPLVGSIVLTTAGSHCIPVPGHDKFDRQRKAQGQRSQVTTPASRPASPFLRFRSHHQN
jgi:hypothetical protein